MKRLACPRLVGLFLAAAILIGPSAQSARADSAVAWGNFPGDGSTISSYWVPVPVSGMDSGVTAVAAGGFYHSLAVKDGGVYAWGFNDFGQLGDGTTTTRLTPVPVSGMTSGVTTVVAGGYTADFSLAVQNGALYAWGNNSSGQLGDGTKTNRLTPVLVIGMDSGVTPIAAGGFHSLAVQNGKLWAWGNHNGQLGNGVLPSGFPPISIFTTPVPVIGMDSGVTAIAAGDYHSLAVKDDAVYSWGDNNYGQLGHGPNFVPHPTPELVAGLESGATAVAADKYFSLAAVNGNAYVWGDENPQSVSGLTPVQVDPAHLSNIVAVAAEDPLAFALSSDGRLWSWPYTGYSGPGPISVPTQQVLPPPGYKFTSISGSDGHVVATIAAVPEPSTFLLAAAALGLCFARRRRCAHSDNQNVTRSTRWIKRRAIALALIAVATIHYGATSAHAAALRTVALSGQQAPGAPAGAVFTGFPNENEAYGGNVVLNNAGQTAFFADASGFGRNIWSEGGGSLHLAAAVGQQAPGLPDGVTYDNFADSWQIVISDTGTTAFPANVIGPDTGYEGGLWSSGPGGSALIAVTGQQAAGTPDGVRYDIDAYNTSLLLNAGQAAFYSQLAGSGVGPAYNNDRGFWAQRGGDFELVARTGGHAPGTPDGVNFSNFIRQSLTFNRFGQTAFQATFTGPGISLLNTGIWSEGFGSLALVARRGDQAPGMPVGAVFTSVGIPDLNNSGQTAFTAAVTGGGVDATNNGGIWLGTPGSISLAVRTGDHVPGIAAGVNFSGFRSPALNDAGQIAFFGTLTGPGIISANNLGLWSGAPDSLALVARTGDHPPGTEDGVVFGGFSTETIGSDPILVLNAAGQAAFLGSFITGPGTGGWGIWATDRGGALELIARSGEPLEVTPGDFRTVSRLHFLDYGFNTFPIGNADGRPSAFNNLGQLAFLATFTDGTSGIFVSNRVAVPEPRSLLLIAVAAPAIVLVRRRGRKNPNCGAHRPATPIV